MPTQDGILLKDFPNGKVQLLDVMLTEKFMPELVIMEKVQLLLKLTLSMLITGELVTSVLTDQLLIKLTPTPELMQLMEENVLQEQPNVHHVLVGKEPVQLLHYLQVKLLEPDKLYVKLEMLVQVDIKVGVLIKLELTIQSEFKFLYLDYLVKNLEDIMLNQKMEVMHFLTPLKEVVELKVLMLIIPYKLMNNY